jgi:hypothetical protein
MINILKEIDTGRSSCKNAGLGINLDAKNREVGNYLKTKIDGYRRIEIYLQRLHSVTLNFI